MSASLLKVRPAFDLRLMRRRRSRTLKKPSARRPAPTAKGDPEPEVEGHPAKTGETRRQAKSRKKEPPGPSLPGANASLWGSDTAGDSQQGAGYTTQQLADLLGLEAQTLRKAHSKEGAYMGVIVPTKLANGRLRWPADSARLFLRGAGR